MARHLRQIHHASQVQPRDASPLSNSQLEHITRVIKTPVSQAMSLFKRGASGSQCAAGGPSSCNSSGADISLPVALGVVIPVAIAIILFVFLHRRHVKKLRAEDANDPHKSLDFGLDPAAPTKNKGKKNMTDIGRVDLGSEKSSGHKTQVSMDDMNLGSPYVLPPALQNSRESLHSMSRVIHSQDDRYRPATTYNVNDTTSIHSYNTRPAGDDASSFAGSVSTRRGPRDEMKNDLLGNAQRMSRSMPPTLRNPPQSQMPGDADLFPTAAATSNTGTASNGGLMPGAQQDGRDSYVPGEEFRKSNNYLGAFIHSREPSSDVAPQRTGDDRLPSTPSASVQQTGNRKSPPPTINTGSSASRPPRLQSIHAATHQSLEQNVFEDGSEYGDGFKVTPPSPHGSQPDQDASRGSSQRRMPAINEQSLEVGEKAGLGHDMRRLSMGVRPLPPDDPTDNPEQRANRIRSFYKEYFDDSKPIPAAGPAVGAEYYEDHDRQFIDDGALFDPVNNQYLPSGPRPFAEGYGRRAMTPPPRVGGRRHAATMSGSTGLAPPGPRAFSSASGRFVPPRAAPKKRMPPPAPLRTLPTPHLLKEDAFALPIDFAPPMAARDRQAGRSESPTTQFRPYSPSVRAHTPLATSFDDLAVMPSPHLLRKSGTFTALDFAPPPRFRNADSGSDSGSIRSNRSGMSNRSQMAVRAGAYRVSRIPKEIAGTKNDLFDSLKPQWNMHNNTGTIGMPIGGPSTS